MSEQETLEKLYYPNKWSKRLSPDTIVSKHIEFANLESERARKSIPCTLNIPYGSLEKEKLDIFGTDLPNDAPIFVFVHGGYWQKDYLRRDTYHFVASNLHKNGIKSIFVGYELCPKLSLLEITKEIGAATQKCIDYAKENNSKGLFLAGYSSGAHLVASLFTTFIKDHEFVKAAILIAGIYDLSDIHKTSVNVALKLDETAALQLSPYRQNFSKEISVPFYVISAENDSPVFKEQAMQFHEKLHNLGLQSSLVIAENVDHFDVVELLAAEDYQLTKLILNTIISE